MSEQHVSRERRSDAAWTIERAMMPRSLEEDRGRLNDPEAQRSDDIAIGDKRASHARRIKSSHLKPAESFPQPAERPVEEREMPGPISLPLGRPDPAPAPARQPHEVRAATEADLDWMMSWGYERFIMRYPRLSPQQAYQLLKAGLQLPYRLVRTDEGAALFVATRAPWEPELVVYEVAVATMKARPAQAIALYEEGLRWAQEIGAVEYKFGSSTGVDLTPIAERIGCDIREQSFTKILKAPPARPGMPAREPSPVPKSERAFAAEDAARELGKPVRA